MDYNKEDYVLIAETDVALMLAPRNKTTGKARKTGYILVVKATKKAYYAKSHLPLN